MPRARVLCLPHAGGGPSVFAGWRQALPAEVDLLVAHLPGRETRLSEAPPADAGRVLDELAAAVAPGPDIVLFGHSWGARLALELVPRLPGVRHLVVSGAVAPHCPPVLPRIAHLPRAEFLARLSALGGLPLPVLAHADLMDLLVPLLRADLRMAESMHDAVPDHPVRCPITALGGDRDPLTTSASLDAWSRWTTASFRRVALPGDHFFHLSARALVVAEVARVVDGLTRSD